MGIENRDYARGSSGGWWGGGYGGYGGGTSPVCKWLIGITAGVFLLQLATTRLATREEFRRTGHDRVSVAEQWLQLDPDKVVHQGQVWRLITYAFCHSRRELFHIVFNMLFLWWFGKTLESMYGSREFLLFYLIAALISAAAFVGLALFSERLNPAVGASGSIMAVVMLYALHFPRQQILLFFVIPLEIRWLVLFYVLYDLYPVAQELLGQPSRDGIAHSAHLGGLAFGFAYRKLNWRLDRLMRGWRLPNWRRRFGSQRKIRIYHPEPPEPREPVGDLEAELDRILEKIGTQGESSLTDREREVLKAASRKYKNRLS
ncbi:MAG: rhomboid family intramembrane serine protease [Planctomycetes bacterium]|nr:rhomboid family intramembrane serine protease [Planctomycetota bacterium]